MLEVSVSSEIATILSFFKFFTVQVQLSAFPPDLYPHPSHPHLPPLIPPALGFVHVSFIVAPENPSPFSPYYLLPPPLW